MNKVAYYLQEHLMGEVMTSADACQYFSTDGSVLTITPSTIAYPYNESDVRKVARFTWQLAERGRVIPITARGSGSDQSGAAIGSGIILTFPAHMQKITEFDSKNGMVTVEPGTNYGKLQQTLITHGRFIPSAPHSMEYSTVGGAIANNASGERSLKYGDTKAYVKSLRVVLANGEVIETKPLSKRELNKKLGLATFEGEVYRAIDTILEEQHDAVNKLNLNVTRNTSGYNLADIRSKNGFDLTPLFVGSQGTLGIITEATLNTEPYNPNTVLVTAMFGDPKKAQQSILELRRLSEMPCSIEMIDKNLLETIEKINPNHLKDVIDRPFPDIILFVEFDDNERNQKRMAKKAFKILEKHSSSAQILSDPSEQAQLKKLQYAVSLLITNSDNGVKALPVIDDGIVPLDKFAEYLSGIYELLKRNNVKASVWGHAGDANLHLQPQLDIGQVGDRQKLFRLLDDYYNLVISLGGSTSGEHGDGRIRGAYLKKMYPPDVYELFEKVKKIFDPYGVLNPGVKIDVSIEDIKPLLRHEYSLNSWYDHLPHH